MGPPPPETIAGRSAAPIGRITFCGQPGYPQAAGVRRREPEGVGILAEAHEKQAQETPWDGA
ncbi:hypothetical protein GCM10009530_72600 [Microbispora corallina]|uniref:Uncharacterized protein n=1 Tax=Microbispora corallina TaxID=83302 RepID=A0ABQ4GAR2_9ACTN|nr:hypothetical protein Mco01_71060 [Microbispora corallina]